MSQQHQKWLALVKERLSAKGWNQTELAVVLGVTPATITRLFKDGHGSDSLRLEINRKLGISESWNKFEVT